MFVEQSSYRETIRIRVMEQVLVGGRWKKRLVQHVGTAHDDLERELLLDRAREIVDIRRHPGQLDLAFASSTLRRQVRAVGEYWEGAELVLGTLFDAFGISMFSIGWRSARS